MKRLIFLLSISLMLFSFIRPADIITTSGKITLLRINDVGTKYGPPSDQLDVEVVIQLSTQPGKSFGFQLRNDNNEPAREGMLELIKDAYDSNQNINIDYNIDAGKSNGTIIRVWLTK